MRINVVQSQYDEPCVRVTNAQSAANGPIVQLHHLNEQGLVLFLLKCFKEQVVGLMAT